MFRRRSRNTTAAPTAQAPDDPWRSGRARFSIRQLRRGRDRQWHFSGQQPEETVRIVVRKHPIFLVLSGWPLLLSLLALFAVIIARTYVPSNIPGIDALWLILLVTVLLICLATAYLFFTRTFMTWWLETHIVTNKRIINSRGLLQPKRQEIPIEKVTQVGVLFPSFLGILLGYGNVHVYAPGSDFVMTEVPNPKRVRDALQGVSDEFQAKKPVKEKPPKPEDAELAEVLEKLAKAKDVPKLPDADDKYPPNPNRIRGPRRTFGGIFRIHCGVHYTSDEFTVKYIQRSRYVLYRNLAPFVLALFALIPLAIFFSSLWIIWSFVVLGLLLVMGAVYTNYVDDVYILTNKRVIDIQRNFVIFFEDRVEAEYKNIKDIQVIVPNVLQRMLDIGTVSVQTPGTSPDIILPTVDHPFVIQDEIYALKSHKEKSDKVKQENDRKEELHLWFGKVLTALEKQSQSRGVPNLQRLDFWEAAQRARALGLRVVLMGEDPSYPHLAPGLVVEQNPPPGTLMQNGGEIRVLLSKRP